MKNFLFTVPQQPEQSLKKTKYKNPCENPLLECKEETRFPILVLIGNTVKANEKIRITAIKQEYINCEKNSRTFTEELKKLKNDTGFEYELDIVTTPYSETIEDHLALFGKLIDHVHDDDSLYTDITYGTKPIPMILLMTLTYTYRFNKNSFVENIIYGQFDHVTQTSSLYDVSALFYMNSTINTMTGSSDPNKFIKDILAL